MAFLWRNKVESDSQWLPRNISSVSGNNVWVVEYGGADAFIY